MRIVAFCVATLVACGAPKSAPPRTEVVVVGPAPISRNVDAGVAPVMPEREAHIEIAIGHFAFCARIGGKIHCTAAPDPDKPIANEPALEGIDDAIAMSLASGFGCAVTRDGSVWCFGDNTFGQLGAGLRAKRSAKPVKVLGISNAKRVVTSDLNACALLDDGKVACWGPNAAGQTGGASTYTPAARELVVPARVAGVVGATSLALGGSSACAVTHVVDRERQHDTMCWGQLTPQTSSASVPPEIVPGRMGIIDLVATAGFFCGLRVRDDQIVCWGDVANLVPGAGRTVDPVVVGLRHPKRLRAGPSHACAVNSAGQIFCWGVPYGGVLGRDVGESEESFTPLPIGLVESLPRVSDVALGDLLSCAVTEENDVYCWGTWPTRGVGFSKRPLKIRITD